MAIIDTSRILDLFARLGDRLHRPALLCLIGSTPGIASGQPARQTGDIDLWHAKSDYDAGDLARACTEIGLLFDPRGEIAPDVIYIQVVRPGIVRLPADFVIEKIGRFGALTAAMPAPEIIVAAKLVRGSDADIQDAIWWVRHRALDLADIEAAVRDFPNERDRETALENMAFMRLAKGRSQ